MDRIAVISDIHANLPALRAVLADIDRRNIRRIFCLGDLVGKGPHPSEAVDLVRERCEVVLQGNWDHKMTLPPENEEWVWQLWGQPLLGDARLDYLRGLPFSHDFYWSGRKARLLHASPTSVYDRIRLKATEAEKMAMFDNTPLTVDWLGRKGEAPDLVLYGDIHMAYALPLENRFLVNVGSVGLPLDENPLAAYVVLEGLLHGEESSAFSVQIVRIPYDRDEALREAAVTGMPRREKFVRDVTRAK
ncbi:metallophosphoesterase family protein [Paenibacillus flagellatus]|uniref:Metallophosphatase family protein n=1 Tax=Paenibacillus flagellatus TaxID=2211139 RepID=A0A2V5KS71_9BACL|nr:metallophosphoesterase family protein [Paenibacillus flagellatus]PYI54417.1 metallophosphatase family protein [Paenibacillus flagellatus]